MAVSLEDSPKCSYQAAAHYSEILAGQILKSGLPPGTVLNVNVPRGTKEKITGFQFTSLSQRRYHDPVVEKFDPRGHQYFWIAGERVSWGRTKTSDHEAVTHRKISVTPLHLDLTDYSALNSLSGWTRALNSKKSAKPGSNRERSKTSKAKAS